MKRVISALVLGLIVISTAQARPPTETELIWSFMAMLSPANSEDKGEDALSDLRHSDLSDEAIQRLRNYSIDAMKQSEDLNKQWYGELCALKGGNRAAIADKVAKIHADNRALEKNLVQNTGLVLSDEEKRALYKLVSEKFATMGVGGDEYEAEHIYRIRTGMDDVDEYMEQLCPASAKEPAAAPSTASVTSK